MRGAETFAYRRIIVECGGPEMSRLATHIILSYKENVGCVVKLCTISALFVLCDVLGTVFIYVRAKLSYWEFYLLSQRFACLASHTSLSDSSVTHPSFLPLSGETSGH